VAEAYITDEATSALDASSRVAVFENIKAWRRNRTTIVITHDLSQIVSDDFVYVMKDGIVAEQGFRSDLMRQTPMHGAELGTFAGMAAEQAIEPLPPKVSEEEMNQEMAEEILEYEERMASRPGSVMRASTPSLLGRPQSLAYFDILEEYSRGVRFSTTPNKQESKAGGSRLRPLSVAQKRLSWAPSELHRPGSHTSLVYAGGGGEFGGSRTSMYGQTSSRPGSRMSRQISLENSTPQSVARRSMVHASPAARPHHQRYSTWTSRRADHDDDLKFASDIEIVVKSPEDDDRPVVYKADNQDHMLPTPGIFRILFSNLPLMPRKWLFVLGLLGSLGHGVSTPIWSTYLTQLMQIVASGGTDPSLTKTALIVLAISAAQAVSNYIQVTALQTVSSAWTAKVRSEAYAKVLAQDKTFFDQTYNSPPQLVQHLIKDVDDMRTLVSQIAGKFVVFVSMIGLGLIWAMVIQWRLTLVGIAIAPVFGGIVVVNEILVGKAESANKFSRDKVAKLFYEVSKYARTVRL
jgi:ATP-binding cassette subfamily B (MDR/TAP) protein 1